MSGPDLLNLVEAAKQGESLTDKDALYDAAKAAIKTVYDPEIPVDVWELGLIYRLEAKDNGRVE
ncbi:MAG: iron-sulfur cluster assembly protein, partial [Alphaproteobacteria bacterium]